MTRLISASIEKGCTTIADNRGLGSNLIDFSYTNMASKYLPQNLHTKIATFCQLAKFISLIICIYQCRCAIFHRLGGFIVILLSMFDDW